MKDKAIDRALTEQTLRIGRAIEFAQEQDWPDQDTRKKIGTIVELLLGSTLGTTDTYNAYTCG